MSSLDELLSQSGQNSGLVQELFELYLKDPSLVDRKWASYFDKLAAVHANGNGNGNGNGYHATPADVSIATVELRSAQDTFSAELQQRVSSLINAYRTRGHFSAHINPVSKGTARLPELSQLSEERYAFTAAEIDRQVLCDGFKGESQLKLRELLTDLREVYCGSIGFEYMHLNDEEQRSWLQQRIEAGAQSLPSEVRKRAFQKMVVAEEFEGQLHRKYVGQKRFSLQGGEAAIPMLDLLLDRAAELGAREAYLGMAHRGRLNVLCNITGKPLAALFDEFEDISSAAVLGAGDVKYHKGYQSEYQTLGGRSILVALAPNPSHLEFVNPVVEGISRSRQDRLHNRDRSTVVPVLIHGDAAFAGQGVVFETLNLSAVEGYSTGGTVHLVINNQIGFTTMPDEYRSTPYSSDMAKAQGPVLHVNGEDIDACLRAMTLAAEFRQRFGSDVIVDLICYRKYGHNEGDDPSFTQPLMYSEIAAKKTPARLYGEVLVSAGVITAEQLEQEFAGYIAAFAAAHKERVAALPAPASPLYGRLNSPVGDTGVKREILQRIAQTLRSYPEGFRPHAKLDTILEKRVQTLTQGEGIDWGFAEGLAFGSLVLEGRSVRLSGQDCGRGTFSQRHLALADATTQRKFYPLKLLESGGATFEVYNSTLSEAAVVGYEFGYASESQRSLVLWEAQFGDFANGAQVAIDQFVASSEAKWNQLSGVVLLLPHGYEGQGPEHSSARLERFLQLCAEGNMQVCYPSNAAQHFHLLRRHALSEIRRPMVVMTPKSLLRLPEAACSADALVKGRFQNVLAVDFGAEEKGGKRSVLLCTGKVYYDLAAALTKSSTRGVRVLRIEQLYPFPAEEINAQLKGAKADSVTWVQEEPENMGAWRYMEPHLRALCTGGVRYAGRPESASPSAGSQKRHQFEQQKLVADALARLS